ncbi:hypothetical protein BI347_22025 [Chromobacterium sphagni]|uniref:Uncharacterized protein n=1 Tax=Chromobacterium sphagni TaxID=1903179 RepID=A0A1S1WTF0_9NEIS|nr:hypothetical protein BI347_22025 [Chromobacterium sphagni]
MPGGFHAVGCGEPDGAGRAQRSQQIERRHLLAARMQFGIGGAGNGKGQVKRARHTYSRYEP